MRHFKWGAALIGAAMLASLPAAAQKTVENYKSVTEKELLNPNPADWLMWRRTLNGWGYSPLDQINKKNVGRIRMVWTRGLEDGFQEGTPLVHDGILYFPNPGDVIQAIDAKTGDLIWEYHGKVPKDLGTYVNAPFINRNIAIYGDYIIDTSADGHVFALDAKTGKKVWDTEVISYKTSVHQTSGPIIADGKVITGRGCDPEGGPAACFITAHDPMTGKELWRTRTIPKPGEAGDETWGDVPYQERRQVGTWHSITYDPDLRILYIGTSVTAPSPKYALAGNDKTYLYHDSTLALDPDTGKIIWYYQHMVDSWDLDHPFERLLIDTAVVPDKDKVAWINPRLKPGEVRKVVTGIPGKTGIVYTLDRKTGEFLWATPTTYQNVVKNIDGATGKVTMNHDVEFDKIGDRRLVCPSTSGGKNWETGAYSPKTGLMYYPLQNTCATETAVVEKKFGQVVRGYGFSSRGSITKGTDKVGTVYAISAKTGDIAWKYEQRAGTMSLVATGGGLVFGGDTNGRFRAMDDKTGKVLWEINLGSGVSGYPVTFSVDGKQYVAVSTGTSVTAGALMALTPELHVTKNAALYVFALP
jgi:PQQ-dependent dehydrogenase (methanol/ethanol family)